METIYSRLRTWRLEQARELQVPSFFVLSNNHLAGIAAACPTTIDALGECRGMGPKKLAQFGGALVALVSQCLAEGLPPGVELAPESAVQTPPELTEQDLADIASILRRELAQRVSKRFRGRFTVSQVEEALKRVSWSA